MTAFISETTKLHTCEIDATGNITMLDTIHMTPADLEGMLANIEGKVFPAKLLASYARLKEVVAVAKMREANYSAIVGV